MTLLDLGRLIKRYWYIVVIIPVVCSVVCAAYLMSTKKPEVIQYTAQSTIVVNSQVNTVVGLAQNNATLAKAEHKDASIAAAVASGTTNIVVTVSSQDEYEAKALAEEIANATLSQAQILFAPDRINDNVIEFDALILDTTESSTSGNSQEKSNTLKYVLVSLVAGLFVGIFIVVLIDLIRRPVISISNIQEITDLPLLDQFPLKDDGSRLLANIRFAAQQNNLNSICLIPVGDNDYSELIETALVEAFKAENDSEAILAISSYESLNSNMNGAYGSQKAQATILIVQQWADSLKQLESTVAELQLARATVVGFVFISGKVKA